MSNPEFAHNHFDGRPSPEIIEQWLRERSDILDEIRYLRGKLTLSDLRVGEKTQINRQVAEAEIDLARINSRLAGDITIE